MQTRAILHIGTHKTGTSSLQTFLQHNLSGLQKRGIFYAVPRGHRNANFLFKDLSLGEGREARAFMEDSDERAHRICAHTILLSAEAFYAMTTFRQLLEGKVVDEYRSSEVRAIRRVRAAIPQAWAVTVICYLRRQDLFLESIYNQYVKSAGYPGAIGDFQVLAEPALDYAAHLNLWRAVFPNARFVVRSHEGLAKGIVNDFLATVLALEDHSDLTRRDIHVNERLGRDVLEYKRILNRIPCSRAERHMNTKAVVAVSQAIGGDHTHQNYLSYEARTDLLAKASQGNDTLIQAYELKPFKDISVVPAVDTYPGLSIEKAIEILVRHRKVKSSFAYRRQWLGGTIADSLQRRGPLTARFLDILRKVGAQKLFK